MKRILIAAIILSLGTACFCWSHQVVAARQRELTCQTAGLAALARQISALRTQQQEVREHLSTTKNLLAGLPQPSPADALIRKVLAGVSWDKLSAAESERLLAELGFDWNRSGDYLFVSKKSLNGISFDAVKGSKLTDAALETLAITPEERVDIEAMTQRLQDKHAAWVKENLQRSEPHDNVLAEYSLPADAAFSQLQTVDFANSVVAILGPERAQWLQDHALDWMQSMGLREQPDISKIPAEYLAGFQSRQNQPTELKVEQYQSGDEWHLNYTLKQQGNTMTTSVNPRQPFPEAFLTAFPGGWKDLADKEGFDLPKEFDQK